jgi:hypothetical protein
MENYLVVLLLLREFARAPLIFLNAFSNFVLIMSENEWETLVRFTLCWQIPRHDKLVGLG